MRAAALALILATAMFVGASPAGAARPATPSPTATSTGDSGRGTSPGVALVFGLLAAAALWQVRRGRRAARDYARSATSHFERNFEPRPDDRPNASGNGPAQDDS